MKIKNLRNKAFRSKTVEPTIMAKKIMLPTMKMITMINTTPSTPSTMTKSSSASSEKSGTLQASSQSTQEQPLTFSSSWLSFGLVPEKIGG